ATSTTRERKTLANCSTWVRSLCNAATLIIAKSREMMGSLVTFSTSSTLTSLYRLASMRFAWSTSASTVIVMRDTSGFSVRPTVSESMLNARRRNREDTRVSTPGLFSTCTTNVLSIVGLFVLGSFHQGIGTPDHFVQPGSCGNHRIDRILLFNLE